MLDLPKDILLTWSRVFGESNWTGDSLEEREIWIMDPCRVLLSLVISLLSVAGPASCFRLCGSELANGLRTVCKGRGYYASHIHLSSPTMTRHAASSFLSSSISTDHHRERRRPRTGLIVNECCHNECTTTIMESYCNRRTTESPDRGIVVGNVNNHRTEGSTSQPQSESNERLTESNTNTATNLEQPTAVSSPDSSPSTDVERPSSRVNTSDADKPKKKKPKKDSSEGRGTSTVSNGEGERTPTRGMSKEERRRLKSEERRASRERKKELSRERRRKKKIQRKLERKKKKRLESAERSRETDMPGLNEETTLIREPLGVDTRRTRSNLPRISRELYIAATLAHETTSGQSEPAKRRRRRSVLQQITDLFL